MPDLDHRLVEPPYLRVADRRPVSAGPDIVIWHLRISQPNVAAIPAPAMHSVEHFLLYELRKVSAIHLAAPMGCGTGLYILTSGLDDFDEMADHLATALEAVTRAYDVPWMDESHCGFAENHSLIGAQNVARWLLSRRTDWEHPGPRAVEIQA